MNKLLKNQLKNTQTLEYIKIDVERRFRQAVIDLVEIMQEGVGYVAFNEESDFPVISLWDDKEENVIGVRVENENNNKQLYIYTDRYNADNIGDLNNSGWFTYTYNINYSELFECLTSIAVNNNE